MADEHDLKIKDHSSALAPQALLSGAVEVGNQPKKESDDTNLEEIKRIQFSGGGSTFSMTLSKEKMWNEVGLSCWHGCNADYENIIEAPGLDKTGIKVFGTGFKMNIKPLALKLHVAHESTKGETESESTSIGFSLGDEDPLDEF
eukprot:4895136-Ditylum_brightwellii.AAC.1